MVFAVTVVAWGKKCAYNSTRRGLTRRECGSNRPELRDVIFRASRNVLPQHCMYLRQYS